MPAMRIVEAVPGGVAREAMAAQMVRQLRPLLRAELHLIRTVCETSEEEQRSLAREGEKALLLLVDKVAEMQIEAQKGNVVAMPDIPNRYQSALADAAKAKLSPERAEHYRAEIDEHDRVRKAVTARNLVAETRPAAEPFPEQRTKIAVALEESADSLASTLDNYMYSSSYYPNLPPGQVVPFLDERQKAIWDSTQKVNISSFNFGIVGLNLSEDDLAEEDDPAVAAEAARSRRAATVRQFLNNLAQTYPAQRRSSPRRGRARPIWRLHDDDDDRGRRAGRRPPPVTASGARAPRKARRQVARTLPSWTKEDDG